MSSFLKGSKLWRYITGDIEAPVHGVAETPTKFMSGLKSGIIRIIRLSRGSRILLFLLLAHSLGDMILLMPSGIF